MGNPELGVLELNASSGGAMQIKNLSPPGNASGLVMSVNVFVEVGASVEIMLYAQTGTPLRWADGGTIIPTPGQWYCLVLDFDAPVTTSGNWDPTDVQVIGVDIQGSGDLRVYLDQFVY